jgi:hypothetical protein
MRQGQQRKQSRAGHWPQEGRRDHQGRRSDGSAGGEDEGAHRNGGQCRGRWWGRHHQREEEQVVRAARRPTRRAAGASSRECQSDHWQKSHKAACTKVHLNRGAH